MESNSSGASKQKKDNHNRFNKNHLHVKRPAPKRDCSKNVVYVNSKSNTKALIKKCESILQDDEKKVIIYCLGAAVQRGILLALQLQEKHPTLTLSPNTYTVELVDDLQPVTDEEDFEIFKRNNSALKITLTSPLL